MWIQKRKCQVKINYKLIQIKYFINFQNNLEIYFIPKNFDQEVQPLAL